MLCYLAYNDDNNMDSDDNDEFGDTEDDICLEILEYTILIVYYNI